MAEEQGSGSTLDVEAKIAALLNRIAVTEQAAAKCDQITTTMMTRVEGMLPQVDALLQSIAASTSNAAVNAAAFTEQKARAEAALSAIEEARRKADSESGFAFNAKGYAEEHAQVIGQIRGTVESTFSNLTTTKASIDQAAQELLTIKASADSQLKAATDAKGVVDRLGAEIQVAKERVDAVLPAIEQGSKDANTISAAKAAAEANASAVAAFQTRMSELVATAESEGNSISKSEEDSKEILAAMREVQSTASEANGRVVRYENQISELSQAFSAMEAKLEGLLPGATSAGLASAFLKQKTRFSKARPWWIGLFVLALFGLMLDAWLERSPGGLETWDIILRHLMNRLPIVGPLLWLAIYAAHQYSLALRMEEDYAFKEAVSTAFEGYKREMIAIGKDGGDTKPLVTLCENVLSSLAERPGRIYDGKTDVVTPLTPILTSLKDSIAGVKDMVSGLTKKDETPK